jgi:hypothetical protein
MGEQTRDSDWSIWTFRKVMRVFHGCKSEYEIHIDYQRPDAPERNDRNCLMNAVNNDQ